MGQTLSALKAMSWTASLPFKGNFCLTTDIFNESLETEYMYDLFEFTTSMYRRSPSILFGLVHLFTQSLVDLERILEAIVLSRIYSKLQNPLGIAPLFPMVIVCVFPPMSQPQMSNQSNGY